TSREIIATPLRYFGVGRSVFAAGRALPSFVLLATRVGPSPAFDAAGFAASVLPNGIGSSGMATARDFEFALSEQPPPAAARQTTNQITARPMVFFRIS